MSPKSGILWSKVDIFYGDLKYQLIKQQKAYVLLNFFSKYSAMADYCSQFAWQTNPVHTLL